MTELHYPFGSVAGDYLRAVVGLAFSLYIFLTVAASFWVLLIFGVMALLFLVFGLRTLQRHLAVIALSEEGIACRDISTKTIYWRDLAQLKLRFYGLRRRSQGEGSSFMQLMLKGNGVKITMDSSLASFDLVAWTAAKAARDNAVSLDPASAGNLLGIGIDPDHDGSPPGNHNVSDT